eukprot:7350936-Prymnesium_polylepis.1
MALSRGTRAICQQNFSTGWRPSTTSAASARRCFASGSCDGSGEVTCKSGTLRGVEEWHGAWGGVAWCVGWGGTVRGMEERHGAWRGEAWCVGARWAGWR